MIPLVSDSTRESRRHRGSLVYVASEKFDLTLHERRRASNDPDRTNSRRQLIDELDRIWEECPRNTNDRKEWLWNALEKKCVDPTLLYEPPLLIPGQNGHCETGRHSLEHSLQCRFQIELLDIVNWWGRHGLWLILLQSRVCLGPQIGQHVLYVKTLYQFPKFLDLARELRAMVYKM